MGGDVAGPVWLGVFGMACGYRTEPKLHNTCPTYAAKCHARVGIDRNRPTTTMVAHPIRPLNVSNAFLYLGTNNSHADADETLIMLCKRYSRRASGGLQKEHAYRLTTIHLPAAGCHRAAPGKGDCGCNCLQSYQKYLKSRTHKQRADT